LDVFSKKYEKIEVLGEGGHGIVYKVKCLLTDQIYAAKFIKTGTIL